MNEMNEIDEALKERLRLLAGRESCTIMIVDDHKLMAHGIEREVRIYFPNATILNIQKDGTYASIDKIIIDRCPDFSLIDGRLNNFPAHPLFGTFGPKIASFVREKCPKSIIFSLSMQAVMNYHAEKTGADYSFHKDQLFKVLQSIFKPKP
jgi:hypothetical protein